MLTAPQSSTVSCSIRDVISNKYCVGCGACALAAPEVFSIITDELMTRQAVIQETAGIDVEGSVTDGDRVCPFSSAAPDETELATVCFGRSDLAFDERLGYHDKVFVGQVEDPGYLLGSSSGGLTSWLTSELLRSGCVDGIIHVGRAQGSKDALFEYVVSDSIEAATNRRKSQYYSTSFEGALQSIRGDGRRYAFVGVPCFVKAVRLLQAADPVLAEQIAYAVGLVCGHLKSQAFAEIMAYQVGVPAGELEQVDFRVKDPKLPSNMYGFGAMQRDQPDWKTRTASSLVGGNWGHALFQLQACDYCDDIFAETADICLGDAWLPAYVSDWRGTNVVVSRRRELTLMLEAASRESKISLEPLTLDEAAQSQAGNFRHRREGLSVRLAMARSHGKVVPKKRVQAGSAKVSPERRRIVIARQRIAQASHVAYLEARIKQDVGLFFQTMEPLINAMDNIYRRAKYKTINFWVRLPIRLMKRLLRPLRGLGTGL